MLFVISLRISSTSIPQIICNNKSKTV